MKTVCCPVPGCFKPTGNIYHHMRMKAMMNPGGPHSEIFDVPEDIDLDQLSDQFDYDRGYQPEKTSEPEKPSLSDSFEEKYSPREADQKDLEEQEQDTMTFEESEDPEPEEDPVPDGFRPLNPDHPIEEKALMKGAEYIEDNPDIPVPKRRFL